MTKDREMIHFVFTKRCTIHCGFQPDTGSGFVHCQACHDRPAGQLRCDILDWSQLLTPTWRR